MPGQSQRGVADLEKLSCCGRLSFGPCGILAKYISHQVPCYTPDESMVRLTRCAECDCELSDSMQKPVPQSREWGYPPYNVCCREYHYPQVSRASLYHGMSSSFDSRSLSTRYLGYALLFASRCYS